MASAYGSIHRTRLVESLRSGFPRLGAFLWDGFSLLNLLRRSIPPYASMTASILLYITIYTSLLQVTRLTLGF